jgi:hypothetical protein
MYDLINHTQFFLKKLIKTIKLTYVNATNN